MLKEKSHVDRYYKFFVWNLKIVEMLQYSNEDNFFLFESAVNWAIWKNWFNVYFPIIL